MACIIGLMVHLQLFVYFIVLFVSATTISLLHSDKKHARYPFSSSFFYFYISLTILVVGFVIANYRLINVTLDRGLISHLIDICLKITTVAVIYTLPVFVISMINTQKYYKTLMGLRIVAINVLVLNIIPYVLVINSPIGTALAKLSHHVQSLVLILVILFMIGFVSLNYKKLKRKESRLILGSMLLLAVVFSPLFIVDMYRNELMGIIPYLPKNFWYTPLYLLGWSICILLIDSKYKTKTGNIVTTDNLQRLVEPFRLTKREIEVLSLIFIGKTGAVIARDLFVSESTIKKHTKSIYSKLTVKNKVEAIHKINQLSH